jgi:glycosyl transferase family 2
MADHGQGRGIGGHGHLDWGERPVPFVVWGEGALPAATSREPRSVCELAVTISRLLGVEAPSAARGRPLVPALDDGVRPSRVEGRCLAIIPAHDEDAAIAAVLAEIPRRACGLPVDLLVVDDGSRDATSDIARAHGAAVIAHDGRRSVGAALRTGLEHARDRGYAAAVYLDGDGEYAPADFDTVLGPVACGRADYVLGSRFLGRRDGMTWHRALANRAATALLSTLMGTVATDSQTGYRAFSARALAAARIGHDYNYAQVLTLSLWGAGIGAVEVPISYRRRASGRSFVRYPEYFARVVPAVWREWRNSRTTTPAKARPIAPASQNGQPPPGSNNGKIPSSGPQGPSGRSVTNEPPATRTSA